MNETEGYCPYAQHACLPVEKGGDRAYFLAHSDEAGLEEDLRPRVAATLEQEGYQAHYADHVAVMRPLLCNSCVQVRSSQVAVFDLPKGDALQTACLWIEIGLAVAHGVPTGLMAQPGATVPALLAGADLFRYATYGELALRLPELVPGWMTPPGVCPLCHGDHRRRKPRRTPKSCLLLPAQTANPNVAESVAEALQVLGYRQADLSGPGDAPLPICRLADVLCQQRLLLVHIEDRMSPEALMALGLGSGYDVPWLLLAHAKTELPECLRGLGIVRYASYSRLAEDLKRLIPAFVKQRNRRQTRKEQQAERGLQEDRLREVVKEAMDEVLAEQAPQELEIFDVVWQVLGQGPWPGKESKEEAIPLAFVGADEGLVMPRAISPKATTLLLAAVEPATRTGWLSPSEATERIAELSDRWDVSAEISKSLMQKTSAIAEALEAEGAVAL